MERAQTNTSPYALLVRPVRDSDLTSLCDIAKKIGAGLTTLPNDRQVIQEKIKHSSESFSNKQGMRDNRLFFFVLEDLNLKKIVGTSAIESKVGYLGPYYSYYLTSLIQSYSYRKEDINRPLTKGIVRENKVLYLSNDYQESSLICSLYVDPAYRASGQGSLMSRIRYLFVAEFPDFFADRFISELRGFFDDQEQFPFWNGVGRKFYNMDILEAEKSLSVEGTRIVTDLNPRLPIYVSLLPQDAQEAIGKVNPHTQPALHVLEKEGFVYRNHIDVLDGGPIVEARKKDLRTVRTSQTALVAGFKSRDTFSNSNPQNDLQYIVCNAKLDFKASLASIEWHQTDAVFVDPELGKLLELSVGDKIRLVAIK